ncbi:MAG: DUF4340 domain-containing protein [Gemmatimonadales bacterium]
MSADTLKRLAAILAAIVVLWIGLTLFRSYRRDRAVTFALPKFNRAAVDQIVIAKAGDTIHLARHDTTWTANGYATLAHSVSALLDAATDTTARGQLVAESPSSYQELGVDSASVHRITFSSAGKDLATLLVGKQGDDFASGFVRVPGDANVYQLPGQLAEFANRTLDDWRDKTIVTTVPDSVDRIEIARPNGSYAIVRVDHGWKIGSAAADSAAVANLLDQLKTLTAAGFASTAQIDSGGHAKPARGVRLFGKDSKTIASLTFDSVSSGTFLARREGDSTVYRIDGYTVKQLTPADSTLRKH